MLFVSTSTRNSAKLMGHHDKLAMP